MFKVSNLFLVLFLLIVTACDNNENTDRTVRYEPLVRGFTQEDINSLTYVQYEWYDIGWEQIVFSSSDEPYTKDSKQISFYIDDGYDRVLNEGTTECKNTNSFKRYASLKCLDVVHVPDDFITIKKINDDEYTISFTYQENGQTYNGSYTGKIEFKGYAIDLLPECY